MVKSNKFDYTGRTSSGPKLGKSIAADLVKRADKKQREAQKPPSRIPFKSHFPVSQKNKKEREKSEDNDTDKDEKDSSKHDTHKLDIKVPGKALGDEGFALLCEGLEKALTYCSDLGLVDLNVSDNALSTRSLARLAPIIRQSKFNLQTLDLSNNWFKVTTTTEAREWEEFLCAFHDCMTLRRLDLSDNPSLGSRAFEVLARVYDREPLVDPLENAGIQSLISLPDEDVPNSSVGAEMGKTDLPDEDEDDEDYPRCANGRTLADTWVLGYRRGLRSLPYLTLANVGLTDTGALFLSYVIVQHHYPTQLITETNATEATSQIKAYRQDANIKGIDWDNNSKTLGKDGLHLLHCAEKQRVREVLGDVDSMTSSAYEIVRPADFQDQKKLHSSSGRRSSIRSMHSIEYGMFDKSDVNSARKKIQRNTIVQNGCGSVEFWLASLKAVACSRRLFMIAPESRTMPVVNRRSQLPESSYDGPVAEIDMAGSTASLGSCDDIRNSLHSMSLKSNLPAIEETQQSKRTYAATLMTTSPRDPEEPILAITDVENAPTIPTVQSSSKVPSSQRNNCASQEAPEESDGSRKTSSDSESSNALYVAIERDDSTSPWTDYQARRVTEFAKTHGGQSDGYRDPSFRCQLPIPVGLMVMEYALEAHDMDVLKTQQQKTAYAWGQKRETLRNELEWRRKDESSQILMLLAGAECVDC